MSCAIGSPLCSGGIYSLYIPWLMRRHEAPASVLAHNPAIDTPIRISSGLRGSTSTELMPGSSPPATPIHCRRSGICQSASFSTQDAPPSSERNSPPGMVPAQRRPATPPGSSAQILPSDQGWGSSEAFSGLGGNTGTAISRHAVPSRRHSLAPKWPRSSAAVTPPSASANTAETGSPRKCASTISQALPRRATSNNPLRVPT